MPKKIAIAGLFEASLNCALRNEILPCAPNLFKHSEKSVPYVRLHQCDSVLSVVLKK
nr:MAG TPA: hypothetical protein [Caudoviricetes sp.]